MKALAFTTLDDHEEIARAEVYGVLAHLYVGPPDEALHERLRTAVTEAPVAGAFLERSWSDVVAAAQRLSVAAIRDEYDALFGGLGKPEVFLYGSFHLAGKLNEKPLVAVRHSLRELGLARSETMNETEDHIASLCEVMRYLIAGEDAGTSSLAAQRRFFDAHLRGWVDSLCSAIEAHPDADFYAALARFTRDFFAVEAQAFDLLDS